MRAMRSNLGHGQVAWGIGLDEVLEMLDRTTKRTQKVLEESKEMAAKQTPVYEQVLLSAEASEAQKVKALFGKAFELDRLERLSAQLSLLYMLQIFAFKVKVLEVEVGNVEEKVAKSGMQEKHAEIKSPLVGTFYAQPSPDSEPFVELGSRVEPDTVVCIVEAMKVMNEIKAEMSGVIVDVVAANGSAVEYGQVLFRIRPE